MKTDEERIKAIVDALQSGPFRNYDVRIHIVPKKAIDVKKEEERKEQQS